MSQPTPTAYVPIPNAACAPHVPTRALLSALTIPNAIDGMMFFCSEAGIQAPYVFSLSSGAVVDGIRVLSTTIGGSSRWLLVGASSFGQDCFNVLSYGAKMDGIEPLYPYYQLALNDALANGGGFVCVPYDPRYPGGFYNWGDGTVELNYSPNGYDANIVTQWGGAAAPVRIPDNFPIANDVIVFDNPISWAVHYDATFFPEVQKTQNFASLIAGNSGEQLYLERVQALGLGALSGLINVGIASLRMKNAAFRGCQSAAGAIINVANVSRGVFFEGIRIIDIGTLGTRGSWSTHIDTAHGILITPNGGPVTTGDSCGIYMRDVMVDERNKKNVRISKGATVARIPWVFLDGVHCNVLTATLVEGCAIEIEGAEKVEIRRSLGIYSSRPLTPAIRLLDVVQAEIYGENTGGAPGDNNNAGVNRFVADENCGSVTLRECDFVLIDSRAKTTTIVKNGETRTISRNDPTTTTVVEERETRTVLTALAGGGGTATIKEACEDAANSFIEETRVSANAGSDVFEQGAKAVLGVTVGQATFPPATTGTNPTNVQPNDVASAAFGATAAAWAAGAGADRQKAILTVTNQHASALDFFVRSKIKKQWRKFSPSQWARLWGDILIGLWLPSGIVPAAGLVGIWLDFSGKGNDLVAAGALRPNYLAAAGPNLLPACQFTGTQRLTCALSSSFRQGTLLAVGTSTGANQTYMALSNAAGAWSAQGVRLATSTVGADTVVQCMIADFAPGGYITDDPAHAYHTQTGTFWASQQNVYTELTRGVLSPGGLGVDLLSQLCVGALQGGGNPLTGEIQALGLLNQALPADYALDAGRLLFEYVNFYRSLCGT